VSVKAKPAAAKKRSHVADAAAARLRIASLGVASAQWHAGFPLFQEGQWMYREQRFSEAAERWGRAALQQDGPSHAHLSSMLIEGRAGVGVDEKRAFALAAAGAALGCAHSKGALGLCYLYGYGVAEDVARGLALGRESEAAGSCFGQYVVGMCYYGGWGGVAKDYAEVVRLYRLAADQGHAVAQYFLGLMFYLGQGVAQDYAEAARLYRLAADQGNAEAQIDLGDMFKKGQGLAQDYVEGARLIVEAVQGNAVADSLVTEENITSLLQLGISREDAVRALSSSTSVDAAASMVMSNRWGDW
jgi:hypothetical protein